MKIDDFIEQFKKRFPDHNQYHIATEQMILQYEAELGYQLPNSFKEFLLKFSNGIFLLTWEPIGGVSKNSPCGDIGNVRRILPHVPDEVLIVETNEWIETNRLISFTTFNAGEHSNDHWVFICEEGILNNEYRVGYITESTLKIVIVLENFIEWLNIYWEYNKNAEIILPLFHILIPIWEDRISLIHG